ncbi:hypothetical protein ONS95_002746 [Cadophora gregata]|uniref:uncharacterized protein n=1 Tax=Cadophora gregata TaxID=51156 RepID=UPI0026DB8C1A|nr:uncharacterized protein ONS95_002746 [Cadophora gregata]KAK0110090.1 hypothetical protein ONS95_002746 [Cadophora gregata]
MGKDHSSISCAFYSARLTWRVTGQTRMVASVLKSSHSMRRKVSNQEATDVENEKEGYWKRGECSEKDYFSVTPPGKIKRPSSRGGKSSCYLCKLKDEKVKVIEPQLPPCSIEPLSCESSAVRYLPITRTQPPSPPLRTTSLPYFRQLRSLGLTANPSAPLPHFSLSPGDGQSFQWLVLASADKHGLHEFMDPVWDILLQVFHTEPCVRHAILAIAALHRDFRHGSSSWESLGSRNQYHIIRHYIKSIRGLAIRLDGITGKTDGLAWETSFITSYLFTVLQIVLKNASGAYLWLRAGYRILKHAFRIFGHEIDGRRLPASMRDVARAFGRLDMRSIRKERSS